MKFKTKTTTKTECQNLKKNSSKSHLKVGFSVLRTCMWISYLRELKMYHTLISTQHDK